MKIGIIGGYGHECVKILPGAELAWACDGYDDAARNRAKAFGCDTVYASADAMLEEFRPDAVYVGSVYGKNGQIAIGLLERRIPVVSEKPIAVDRTTLERLAELTASGEAHLIAEFTMRWTASLEKAREIILSGGIGEPVLIQAQKSYKFGNKRPDFYCSRELCGGIIPWVASHAIDYAAWCTGLRYEAVHAIHGNRFRPDYPGMEDHAAMMFEMTGGVPCVVTADFLRPAGAASHGDDRLRVTGSAGLVEVRGAEVFYSNATEDKTWCCKSDETHGIRRAGEMLRAAMGEEVATISTADCLHIADAILSAREAADSGRLVQIGGAIS